MVDKFNDSSPTYSTPFDRLWPATRVRSPTATTSASSAIRKSRPTPGFLNLEQDPARSPLHPRMLDRNFAVKVNDVTDGTSNTFFVAERSSNLAYPTWAGRSPAAGSGPHPGLLQLRSGRAPLSGSRPHRRLLGRAGPHAQQYRGACR